MTTNNQENLTAPELGTHTRLRSLWRVKETAGSPREFSQYDMIEGAVALTRHERKLRNARLISDQTTDGMQVVHVSREIKDLTRSIHDKFVEEHTKNQFLGREDRIPNITIRLWPAGLRSDELSTFPDHFVATKLFLEAVQTMDVAAYTEFLGLTPMIHALSTLNTTYDKLLRSVDGEVTSSEVKAASLNAKEAYFQVYAMVLGKHAIGDARGILMLDIFEETDARYLKSRDARLARKASKAEIARFNAEYDAETDLSELTEQPGSENV